MEMIYQFPLYHQLLELTEINFIQGFKNKNTAKYKER